MPRSKVTLPGKWAYDLWVIEGCLLMESSSSFTSWDLCNKQMFYDAFFQNHCSETIPGKFRMIKTNDVFFWYCSVSFLIATFFDIMICVPLGLYFPSPAPKKVPFENYVDPRPVHARRRRPRPRRSWRPRKRRAEELPRRLGFFHGSQTWEWMVRMEDHR